MRKSWQKKVEPRVERGRGRIGRGETEASRGRGWGLSSPDLFENLADFRDAHEKEIGRAKNRYGILVTRRNVGGSQINTRLSTV